MYAVATQDGLRSRTPFFALLGAGAVSLTGSALTRVAVPWFVLVTGGSAAQLGVTLFFQTLPLFLGSFFGGVVVDRLGHKRSSVVADVASGTALVLVPFCHALGALPFGLLLALIFLGGILDAPGAAARQALLLHTADETGTSLERANAAYQAVTRLAILIGPAVGGVLIAIVGATGVLLLDAATFAFSAVVVGSLVPGALRTVTGERVAKGPRAFATDLVDGLRCVVRDGPVRTLVGATTLFSLFLGPLYFVVLPVYLKDAYGEAIGMGLLYSAFGGGAVLGALAYGLVGRHVARRTLFLLGAFGVTLGSAATAGLPALPAILAGSALVGLAFGPLGVLAGVVTGERTPRDLRGRVFGLVAAGSQLATPVGSLLAGFLLALVSIQPLIAALAAGCAVVALGGLFAPSLRMLEKEDAR